MPSPFVVQSASLYMRRTMSANQFPEAAYAYSVEKEFGCEWRRRTSAVRIKSERRSNSIAHFAMGRFSEAFNGPRIDASSDWSFVDDREPGCVLNRLPRQVSSLHGLHRDNGGAHL